VHPKGFADARHLAAATARLIGPAGGVRLFRFLASAARTAEERYSCVGMMPPSGIVPVKTRAIKIIGMNPISTR
jgi:hypothetical protein